MPKTIASPTLARRLDHAHFVVTAAGSIPPTQSTAGEGVSSLASSSLPDGEIGPASTRGCRNPSANADERPHRSAVPELRRPATHGSRADEGVLENAVPGACRRCLISASSNARRAVGQAVGEVPILPLGARVAMSEFARCPRTRGWRAAGHRISAVPGAAGDRERDVRFSRCPLTCGAPADEASPKCRCTGRPSPLQMVATKAAAPGRPLWPSPPWILVSAHSRRRDADPSRTTRTARGNSREI